MKRVSAEEYLALSSAGRQKYVASIETPPLSREEGFFLLSILAESVADTATAVALLAVDDHAGAKESLNATLEKLKKTVQLLAAMSAVSPPGKDHRPASEEGRDDG